MKYRIVAIIVALIPCVMRAAEPRTKYMFVELKNNCKTHDGSPCHPYDVPLIIVEYFPNPYNWETVTADADAKKKLKANAPKIKFLFQKLKLTTSNALKTQPTNSETP